MRPVRRAGRIARMRTTLRQGLQRFGGRPLWRPFWPWLLGGLAVVAAGALLIVRWDIAQRRELFQADARVAHRLLSQRVVRLDAVLVTLSVLPLDAAARAPLTPRLLQLYPDVHAVLYRDTGQAWPDAALRDAEARSRASGQAALARLGGEPLQLTLVQAAGSTRAVALQVDVQRLLPWAEWPLVRGGPVRVSLQHAGRTLPLQTGSAPAADQPLGWTPGFVFNKAVAGSAQPVTLQLQRATGPAQWPWAGLLLWVAASALATAGAATLWHSRRARERAQALLRIGQVSRLNTLGEMAAGLAHELNQPLAAVVANAQAARRLLDDAEAERADLDPGASPAAHAAAREAMQRVVAQGRRAADVVARLRRRLDTSADGVGVRETLDLGQAVRNALDLLAPELHAQGVALTLSGPPLAVRADPVALAQIIHNLVSNALHALADVPTSERQLALTWRAVGEPPARAELSVRDTGPGLSPDALLRVFEPFYTTRADGLGLGLSLCESLAQAMDGALSVQPGHSFEPARTHARADAQADAQTHAQTHARGAEFRLVLPLATAAA